MRISEENGVQIKP